MELTGADKSMLAGDAGEAARLAMEALVIVGESEQAPHLVDITQAHIDGCLYHGPAGLEFVEMLVEAGGRVTVPTTLNVSSLDLLHPDLYRGEEATANAARRLMDAHVELGCSPTWTCAPYQLPTRPSFGSQIAWGESNAIAYANSVLGARTARYGDFLDLYCAITGRAPYFGLHTDEGRLGSRVFHVDVEEQLLDSDMLYPLVGHVIGRNVGQEVPIITGLDSRATEDRLKALGAAAASAGAVGMFHVVGVTPEAPTLEEALGQRSPASTSSIDKELLAEAAESLDHSSGSLGAVSVGTPHFSYEELARVADLASGRKATVPFYINTSRAVLAEAETSGTADVVRQFGAQMVTDTCTYITPIMGDVEGDVMTNSAKWAYYAPGNLGVNVVFGSLRECVESAVAGERIRLGLIS